MTATTAAAAAERPARGLAAGLTTRELARRAKVPESLLGEVLEDERRRGRVTLEDGRWRLTLAGRRALDGGFGYLEAPREVDS